MNDTHSPFFHEDHEALSPAGQLRRGEILTLAHRQAYGLRRRLRFRRTAVLAVVAGLALALTLRLRHSPTPRPLVHAPSSEPAQAKDRSAVALALPQPRHRLAPGVLIEHISTDSTLVSRLTLPPQSATWQKLSDDELLERLADTGRPAGLAYVSGHAQVLYREKPMRLR